MQRGSERPGRNQILTPSNFACITCYVRKLIAKIKLQLETTMKRSFVSLDSIWAEQSVLWVPSPTGSSSMLVFVFARGRGPSVMTQLSKPARQ